MIPFFFSKELQIFNAFIGSGICSKTPKNEVFEKLIDSEIVKLVNIEKIDEVINSIKKGEV